MKIKQFTFGETTLISSFRNLYFPSSRSKGSPQYFTQATKHVKLFNDSCSCGDCIL